MTYLLDTDTLIFLVRGLKVSAPRTDHEKELRKKAGRIFSRCRASADEGHILALSAITAAELEYGARKNGRYDQEILAVQKILAPFQVLAFDGTECARHYGELRRELEASGIPIGAMDLLIAAHAKATGSVLVTNNRLHFDRVKGLGIENWT